MIETSLGYFINPLLTVLLGVGVLVSGCGSAQWAAVASASLRSPSSTVDYGRPPWIALVLALSFGSYGFCARQRASAPSSRWRSRPAVQFVPAAIALAVIAATGTGVRHVARQVLLLAGTRVITVIPLLLFASGTRPDLPLSVVGLLQYLTPVLQFAVGVRASEHEPRPPLDSPARPGVARADRVHRRRGPPGPPRAGRRAEIDSADAQSRTGRPRAEGRQVGRRRPSATGPETTAAAAPARRGPRRPSAAPRPGPVHRRVGAQQRRAPRRARRRR